MAAERHIGRTPDVLTDGTDVTGESDRALIIRAVNATLEQATQIGRLAREVSDLTRRVDRQRTRLKSLSGEVEDTGSYELRQLRDRNKWITGILAGVIVLLVGGILLRWLGVKP